VSLADIAAFVDTFPGSGVSRVFLAGGEPLIWPPIFEIVEAIKAAGVQVVLCTNGIPLGRPEISDRIVELGVDAVSVSLDSTDPATNDRYRPARNAAHGWADVVTGIRALLAARAEHAAPRVGLYTVVTRQNLHEILPVGRLAAELGCDYYVPQPISLAADHILHTELSLTPADTPTLESALTSLYAAHLPVRLPAQGYAGRFLSTIATDRPGFVPDCFGGRTLFFVEPDGSVWDCPSALKIASTPDTRRRSIVTTTATDVFTPSPCTDCALFSRDCVNMWPLMEFGAFALTKELQ
jgi:MoaA/NifB/PqqE/SkfB family radical SAM enzyme